MNARADTMGRPHDDDRSHGRDRTELRVTRSRDGTLTVIGDLDASTSSRFERALQSHETTVVDDRPLVIDVSGVGFTDSSGLRTLVAASLRAGRRGARVVLRNAGPELTRLLEITGLTAQFGVPPRADGDRRPWWSTSTATDG